jgi:hypothetical protein
LHYHGAEEQEISRKHSSQSSRPLTVQEAAAIFVRFVRGDIYVSEEKGLVKRLKEGAEVVIPFLLKKVRQSTPAEQDVTIQLLPLVGGQAVKDPLLEADKERRVMRYSRVTSIYKFKVSLQDARSISRIIEIKGNQTLHTLHKAIFSAFDRFDEHLYAFYMNNKPYDEASAYELRYTDERIGRDASRTTIDSLGLRPKQKFLYIFDFGDDWRHTVEVLGIGEAISTGRYPRLVEKKGDSPPQYPDVEEDDVS